jgi:predicted GH43/DUF377 family glycosyl hydrolase
MSVPTIVRTDVRIAPDASRVLIRPFVPNADRVVKIMARIAAQSDAGVSEHLAKIFADFSNRHIEVESTFLKRYESIRHLQITDLEPSRERKLLIGSYFTSEYSVESAALFNPSVVPHHDQSNLPAGSMRLIMSLRAVGEGHISSVAFRCGTIDADNQIVIDTPTPFVETPRPIVNREFDNRILSQKIMDMRFNNEYTDRVFALLPDRFTFQEINDVVADLRDSEPALSISNKTTRQNLFWIASSNYNIRFDSSVPIGGRALFPYSPSEKHGIEDARFVRFVDDDGTARYYATATAWDGREILSQMIETEEFLTFKVRTLNGEAVRNKGMALFPRKIHGKYAMISRQDNENIYLMYSDHVQFWREAQMIVRPTYPWEYYQMGNCGSPIETAAGWLLITHGVGAMRRYAIGAVLLDKDDPSKVLGRTEEPFLVPIENEREGYVPNVVYSCGSMIHNGQLLLPYAMADYATRVALVDVEELLSCMQ